MKVCNTCNIEKDISLFSKRSANKDGLNNTCKECVKVKMSGYFKIYYDSNKEKISNYKKEHYKNNVDKYTQRSKKQKIEDRENYLESLKKWRSENKDYNKKYLKEWFLNNPNKRKEYWENLRNNSPHIVACRTILRNALQRMGKSKEDQTIELLGYSAEELKKNIESKFKDGMSWENWGEWHIDHIIPVSKFDKESLMSEVNRLENLQPLWAFENLIKSNKVDGKQ